MNQDQVKERLLRIRETDEYFTVIFSGKSSKKVDGLYKPGTREIILHSKNFTNDNELMYTAVHEYAHHLQFTSSPLPISIRTHTVQFWSLFHNLLNEAERIGLQENPFENNQEFIELTGKIKEKFLAVNGELMKELGRLLMKAQTLCEKYRTSFTDYLDRVLIMPRSSAATIIKTQAMDLDPRIGFENMRALTRIRDNEVRKQAETAFLDGESPDMVTQKYIMSPFDPDPLERLIREKDRIEKQIGRLQEKVAEIKRRLEEYGEEKIIIS